MGDKVVYRSRFRVVALGIWLLVGWVLMTYMEFQFGLDYFIVVVWLGFPLYYFLHVWPQIVVTPTDVHIRNLETRRLAWSEVSSFSIQDEWQALTAAEKVLVYLGVGSSPLRLRPQSVTGLVVRGTRGQHIPSLAIVRASGVPSKFGIATRAMQELEAGLAAARAGNDPVAAIYGVRASRPER
jgi:hypothetical protein